MKTGSLMLLMTAALISACAGQPVLNEYSQMTDGELYAALNEPEPDCPSREETHCPLQASIQESSLGCMEYNRCQMDRGWWVRRQRDVREELFRREKGRAHQ